MKISNAIYSGFIIFLLLFIAFLYINIEDFEKKITQNIRDVILTNTSYLADNIVSIIKNSVGDEDIYTILKNNPQLRHQLESKMQVLVTPSFKFIYMLYKDKDGRYRYLLDGSKEDKAFFDSKFDVNEKEWNKVYATKKTNIIFQDDLTGLWITTLRPYMIDGNVQGVVAIDFSTKLLDIFSEIMKPMKEVFLYIFFAIIFLFAVILYQIIIQRKTKKETVIDPLTHAYNRVFLRDFIDKIDFYHYDIVMLDLDYFKKINDNYGHKAGDFILESFVGLVKKNLRDKDYIVRFGGEEFLIFLYKERKKQSSAIHTLERIRKRIENYNFVYNDTVIKVTVSIGLVDDMHKYKTIQEVMKKVDERLYAAKHSGRNIIIDSDVSSTNMVQTALMEIEKIKLAIDEGRVFCHFQPIVEIQTQSIVKYEALIRLKDEDGTTIYPNSFLDAIEGTNIYRDMTKKLLEIVFEQTKQKQVAISINLNLSDIADNSIYTILSDELLEHKLYANYLTIELLEYETVLNESLLIERLREIKSYGVSIALDDFGSGYSNFSIFEAFPIDIVKIDGSLIKNIDTSKTSYSIVEAIVRFATNLEMDVVGEFVHNEAVLHKLKELNLQYGQGFHLGKPQEII